MLAPVPGFVAILLTMGVYTAPTGQVRFPGPEAQLRSPSNRYSAEWRWVETGPGAPTHRLLLREEASGRTRILRSFPRWVLLAWAPAKDRLAVTDGTGTDSSNTWVYDATGHRLALDVAPLVRRQLSTDELRAFVSAHHVYIETVRWLDKDSLLVKVWGYGDGGSLDRNVTVAVGAAFHE